LKARDSDPSRSIQACEALGAEDKGTLIQRDTYFEAPQGRLKLREEPDEVAQLIAYQRPDLPGARESHYRLIEVREPAELREALAAVLGVTVMVSKVRRLFIFESVRIHIDRVDGLGDFIELEGVAAGNANPDDFARLLDGLRQSLGIRDGDLLSESYSDLLPSTARA
jgi:adenylate cyclase class 2